MLWISATKVKAYFLLCLLLELVTLWALDFGNQVSLFSTLLVAVIVDSFPHLLFVCLFVFLCVCMSRVRVWDWLCWQAILIFTSHFGFYGTYWQTQLILPGDLSKITSLTFICHVCGSVSSHSCVHVNVKYKIMAPFVGMKIINKRKNN